MTPPPPLPSPLPRISRTDAAGLIDSVRRGTAGFAIRLGLSLAGGAALVGLLMVFFGIADFMRQHIRDEHVAIGVVFMALAWVGLLYPLWATYSRKQHLVRTILVCVGILIATIGIATAFGVAMRSPEFFIAATILLGLSGIIAVITTAAHLGGRGRALRTGSGAISVQCPTCGYSMAGLESSACPECGTRYTLDELIRAQDYDSLRHQLKPPQPLLLDAAPNGSPKPAP